MDKKTAYKLFIKNVKPDPRTELGRVRDLVNHTTSHPFYFWLDREVIVAKQKIKALWDLYPEFANTTNGEIIERIANAYFKD